MTAASTTTTTAASTTYDADGPFLVGTEDRAWTDESRPTAPGHDRPATAGRRLQVRLYFPTMGEGPADGPFPLFVWAHGLDATVDYFDPLLRAWAARGYVVAAPTFPLTHRDAAGGTVFGDVVNQPADVSYILDRLTAEDGPSGTLHPALVDPTRIAVGGHSLGAVTSLALGGSPCCADDRIDAVVSVDGEPPPMPGGSGVVAVPLLLIHGTADDTFPLDRSRTVLSAATGHRYLIVIQGAPHTPFRIEGPNAVIASTVGDFLDVELKGRPDWLEQFLRNAVVPGVSTLEQGTSPP